MLAWAKEHGVATAISMGLIDAFFLWAVTAEVGT